VGTHRALACKSLPKKPDAKSAANMKAATRSYLQQVMKFDPERMRLNAQGLVFHGCLRAIAGFPNIKPFICRGCARRQPI
jgi:hypothetical protein